MLSVQWVSLLPLLWALLAALLWWGQLRAPMLFLVVAMFVGFGAQVIASFLWAAWQARNNQFVSVPPAEVSAHLASIAAFKATSIVVMVVPIYWLLSKRL